MKKVLSVFLAVVMIFSMSISCFAEDARFNMYLVTSGSDKICRGETSTIRVVYDKENCENIDFVWRIEGEGCGMECITDNETGLITGVKLKGLKEGNFYVVVKMVSEDGEIIQSASKNITVVGLTEKVEYEVPSIGFSIMFLVYFFLDLIIVPFSSIVNLFK